MLRKMLVYAIMALISAVITIAVAGCSGCSDDDGSKILEPEPFPTDAEVFRDEFGDGVTYEAFLNSKYDAVQTDQVNTYLGSQALQVTVPDASDATDTENWFAGGAFTCAIARDLTGYNALTFYAKASRNVIMNETGIGNDNTGTSKYTAALYNLPITTSWEKYTIPIPLPGKLSAERGLFYFAEGHENEVGCQIWLDEIIFENLSGITNPQPALPDTTIEVEETDTIVVLNATVTFDVDGSSETVSAMPGYFTFASSDNEVVTVTEEGAIVAVGVGEAELTATLGTVAASGAIPVTVGEPSVVPTEPAPTPPAYAEADVISFYSNAFDADVTVDSWCAEWEFSEADVYDETIDGDDVMRYELNESFAGIDFSSSLVDVSAMTHFHMDIWTPNSTLLPAQLKIKLVDFGADGVYGGTDDFAHELTFDASTTPALASEEWVSFDLPMTVFDELLTRAHLANIVISGDLTTVWVDNIYFYQGEAPAAPVIAATPPTIPEDSVISLFSDEYTDVLITSWLGIGSGSGVVVDDYAIGLDSMKKYTNLSYAWVDLDFANPVDVSTMTHFHMDVWTPDPTYYPNEFTIKLWDFGVDGAYGGGDDVMGVVTFDESTMATGLWVHIDVPMDAFDGLTEMSSIGRLQLYSDPNTVFVDNIYFYDCGIPLVPQESAPTPTEAEADVLSIFSDEYTSTDFDTWSSEWDEADVVDFAIGDDNLKKYYNIVFTIAEYLVGETGTMDISDMTHFHIDVWTPKETNASSEFKIKLVDFGPNGVWDEAGDDTEHELTFDETVMATGEWVSLDIPLADFAGMTTTEHFAQLILSGSYETVFIDNVYFHK